MKSQGININTVEQKFCEIAASGVSLQGRGEKHYIFATGSFRGFAKFRENREIFLHVKISCFTVPYDGIGG